MRFFGLKSCDTCRKALRALQAAGHTPDVIDVRADGLAPADLSRIVVQFGAGAINKASATWRSLSDAEKTAGPAALLAAHPTVMKRPVIETDGQWTIGWKPQVQAIHLGE
ncbi:ArsC/Spx/MgsR family protein [Yoonia sp.]|jgi:arsenate reductase-like glutaredoxin family protein|uniref:arsenate reductase family protein n=1 Tax=Yoonia sp. TaxID=2212373 RepID=UPI0025F50CDA|nr:ArsC/Spx/MgsR family protein [Yoonia sp.]